MDNPPIMARAIQPALLQILSRMFVHSRTLRVRILSLRRLPHVPRRRSPSQNTIRRARYIPQRLHFSINVQENDVFWNSVQSLLLHRLQDNAACNPAGFDRFMVHVRSECRRALPLSARYVFLHLEIVPAAVLVALYVEEVLAVDAPVAVYFPAVDFLGL